MELKRVGSQPSMKGPEQYFTGTVRIDMLNAPGHAGARWSPGRVAGQFLRMGGMERRAK